MAVTLRTRNIQAVLSCAAFLAVSSWSWADTPTTLPSTLPATNPATLPSTLPATTNPTTQQVSDRDLPKLDLNRYLFEDQIQPGMKGYGLTVMHGAEIQKFGIEVIDVIKNFTPGNNVILVRCSGLGLEKSGIIAGMSGSPVFINGKMIGAVAYGWGLSKDPIGGIQPIRQMLNIPLVKPKPDQSAEPVSRLAPPPSWTKSEAAQKPGWKQIVAKLSQNETIKQRVANVIENGKETNWSEQAKGLKPLVSPLMATGISTSGLNHLHQSLSPLGLMPVNAGPSLAGAGTPATTTSPAGILTNKQLGGMGQLKPTDIKLEPGSAIAIPIVTGDMDLSAIGTVTEVADGHFWAFGHAMFAEGVSELPISTGYIYTVMPNLVQSFKMGSSFHPTGQLISDEQTGIVGHFGPTPKTVPISMGIKTTDGIVNKVYKYQMAPHPMLTAGIVDTIISESALAQRQLPRHFTAHIHGHIKFDDTEIQYDNTGTSNSLSLYDLVMAVSVLTDNPYKNLQLKDLQLQMDVDSVDQTASIQNAKLDRTVVAPGSEVKLHIKFKRESGQIEQLPVRIKIPENTPDGIYNLMLGTNSYAMDFDISQNQKRYQPDDIKSLIAATQMQFQYPTNNLYLRLALEENGIAGKKGSYPNLPDTRRQLYPRSNNPEFQPTHHVVGASIPVNFIPTDTEEDFQITVDKNADKRYYTNNNHLESMSNGSSIIILRSLPGYRGGFSLSN